MEYKKKIVSQIIHPNSWQEIKLNEMMPLMKRIATTFKSNLKLKCYSQVYVIIQTIFKKCIRFTDCVSNVNNTPFDHTKDLHIVISI